MAKKRIDVSVTSPGPFSSHYYVVAWDEQGNKVPEAYGRDDREARLNVMQKVRARYGSGAEVLD